jgi:hypothetical protein
VWIAVLGGSLLLPALAAAQDSPPDSPPQPLNAGTPAKGNDAPSPGTAPDVGLTRPSVIPRVVEAKSNDGVDGHTIGLGYVVAVKADGLADFLESTGTKCENLTLFINDVPIEGLTPDSCTLTDGRVRYTLVRDEQSAAAWRLLFTEPWEFTSVVSVSIGPRGRLSWPSTVDDLVLVILPQFWVYAYFVGLALALLLFIWLARSTSLLRDRGEDMAEGTGSPYSLSRFQLGFWIFLVTSAYIFIWMITGELDTITGSVLALLGIGSGTALGAALIDQSKDEAKARADGAAVTPATAPAETTTTTAVAAPAAAPAPQPAAQGVSASRGFSVSRGFLRDVLSDERGISIHRFQLFVWTLVLGVIFCSVVYGSLEMPQFSSTMLGLMGISSGTYLGLKMPEGNTGRKE